MTQTRWTIFFGNTVSTKVYEGRREPFRNVEELKARIKAVWLQATTPAILRKAIAQFRPRLKAIVNVKGASTKMLFG